jgi:hypothetical protein
LTPEAAFSHPFISKAVNELKCLRTGTGGGGIDASVADATTANNSASHKGDAGGNVQKQNNNNSNNSSSIPIDRSKKQEAESGKAPNSARSNQSDSLNVHASLPKISNR